MTRFVTLQGKVTRVGERSIHFREEEAAHDICLPHSQLSNPHEICVGDPNVDASVWILNKLADEGKR